MSPNDCLLDEQDGFNGETDKHHDSHGHLPDASYFVHPKHHEAFHDAENHPQEEHGKCVDRHPVENKEAIIWESYYLS